MSEFEAFTEKLALLGEDEVRLKFSQGVWANRHKTWVQEWLANLETSRAIYRAEKALALSEASNEIARSALNVSRCARTISIFAAATAIIAAVIQFFGLKQ